MPKPLLPRFVTTPELFEHEESIALRSYLLPDERDEFFIGQNSLILGEGVLIMTNYRLILKGRPVNLGSMFEKDLSKRNNYADIIISMYPIQTFRLLYRKRYQWVERKDFKLIENLNQ
jgi:hypothetical protein